MTIKINNFSVMLFSLAIALIITSIFAGFKQPMREKTFKDFFNNKPKTRYNLTDKGKKEFTDYVNTLENILQQYKDSSN